MMLVVFVIALICAGAVYFRFKKLDVATLHQRPPGQPAGHYPSPGGFQCVIPAADPGVQDLARLCAVILDTPRTVGLGGALEDRHLSFVTRSGFWGFPDITNVVLDNGELNISSHLVFGRRDFGVNEARIKGWLATLGKA